jgi:hypothetical protein
LELGEGASDEPTLRDALRVKGTLFVSCRVSLMLAGRGMAEEVEKHGFEALGFRHSILGA